MKVTVRLMSSMSSSRSAEVSLPDETPRIADVLEALVLMHPAIGRRILAGPGVYRRDVNVFIDGENVRALDGLNTRVADGRELWIVTPESGG